MTSITGRPRVAGDSPTGLGTRADLLHAGATLFCTVGYGGTSTHALAKAAGIRQASLYHYFSGKHEILLELLIGTVRPSLEVARALSTHGARAEARLWALCVADVRLLCSGDMNVGSLYLLPELVDDRFSEFHAMRLDLENAYEALVTECLDGGADARHATVLVMGLVESVILQRRREPDTVDETSAPAIADAALKTLDVPHKALPEIRAMGASILNSFV